MKSEITFFCELRAQELKKLFEDRFVFDDLKTLNAGISLGILDLSPERANVVKQSVGGPGDRLAAAARGARILVQPREYVEATATTRLLSRTRKTSRVGCSGLDYESDINEMKRFNYERELSSKKPSSG